MSKKSGFPPEVVALAFDRAGGRCERCGKGLAWETRGYLWSAQHRMARGMGGRSAQLLDLLGRVEFCAILCGHGVSGCHGRVETVERKEAYDDGWALRMGQKPQNEPINHYQHGPVILTPEGTYAPPPT